MSNEDQTISTSELRAAFNALDLNPKDVLEVNIEPGHVIVREIIRGADGTPARNPDSSIRAKDREIPIVSDPLCEQGSIDGSNLVEGE